MKIISRNKSNGQLKAIRVRTSDPDFLLKEKRMRIMSGLVIFFQLIFLTACSNMAPAEPEQKTLKLVRFDQQTRQAWYVPTRAILTGPGNATAPLRLLIGNEILLQGMLKLHESSDELSALEKNLQAKYGQDFALRRDLTCSIFIKAELNGKTVFEHQTMSGNQGLPIMMNVPDPGSASLKIHLQFSPSSAAATAVRKTVSFSQSKTVQTVDGQHQAEEQAVATAAVTTSQSSSGAFSISHEIEL